MPHVLYKHKCLLIVLTEMRHLVCGGKSGGIEFT